MSAFVLLVRPRDDEDPTVRLGLTVSRKVGNAVIRNRMKRRFRELARIVLPEAGIKGADHVLIGRSSGVETPFVQLKAELRRALEKIKTRADDKGRDKKRRPSGKVSRPGSSRS